MAKEKVLLFLYGNGNILGSILGLCGLGLFFGGVIKSFWAPIVVGLYAIGYLMAPRSRHYELRLSQEMSADEIRERLQDLIARIQPAASEDILSRVTSISESIQAILPRITAAELSSDRNVFTIRQTALDYLPRTLEHYLNLPRAYARFHHLSNGKTPHQLLLDQLEILDSKMKEIVINFCEEDSMQLLVNGRFLEDQFLKRRTFDITE